MSYGIRIRKGPDGVEVVGTSTSPLASIPDGEWSIAGHRADPGSLDTLSVSEYTADGKIRQQATAAAVVQE